MPELNFFFLQARISIETTISNLRTFDPNLSIKKVDNQKKCAVIETDLNEEQVSKVEGVDFSFFLNGICDQL